MSAVVHYEEFETKTGGRLDTIDVTEDVEAVIARSSIREGSALVFSPHTTCSVLVTEPGARLRKDLASVMQILAPDDGYYAHDDLSIRTENLIENEPANAPSHIFHVVAGNTSEVVPIADGRLRLGEKQRILFVELDSSRERRYVIQIMSDETGAAS